MNGSHRVHHAPVRASGAMLCVVMAALTLATPVLAAAGRAAGPERHADDRVVTTFPDTFSLDPGPPPPVGVPRIPTGTVVAPGGAGPSRPAFKVRRFALPASVDWPQLFPADRWLGPAAASGPTDADGVPMRLHADKLRYYSPTNLGLQALRRLEGYRRTGDPSYLASARRMADKLREIAVAEDDRVWLPFPYDDKRARMKAPWVNALGQAVALALFSRLHRLEGRTEDLDFATGLFRSFTQLRRADGPWVSVVDPDGYVWFEHYPDGLRGHVLNAHAYAVLALRDYWQETRSAEARRWLEGGLTTLRDRGPEFRRPGTWSWYNLRNPVAHANYHLFHIRQLRALGVASGDSWFAQFAALLADDFRWSEAAPWMQRASASTGAGALGG